MLDGLIQFLTYDWTACGDTREPGPPVTWWRGLLTIAIWSPFVALVVYDIWG
jgi:hypothetical protein